MKQSSHPLGTIVHSSLHADRHCGFGEVVAADHGCFVVQMRTPHQAFRDILLLEDRVYTNAAPDGALPMVGDVGQVCYRITDAGAFYVFGSPEVIGWRGDLVAWFGQITQVRDVQLFFRACVDLLGLGFHPDTDFAEYTGLEGKPVFSDEEATRLNGLMQGCIDLQDQLHGTPGAFCMYEIGAKLHDKVRAFRDYYTRFEQGG
jgi:hypothetical protein